MVLSRRLEPPDLVLATIAGLVTPLDQAALVSFVRNTVSLIGSARVLLQLEQFAGWSHDAGFESFLLWLRDDEGVTRIAITGEAEWEIAVLQMLAQPIRRVPLAYFLSEAAARRWLELPSRPGRSSAEGHQPVVS